MCVFIQFRHTNLHCTLSSGSSQMFGRSLVVIARFSSRASCSRQLSVVRHLSYGGVQSSHRIFRPQSSNRFILRASSGSNPSTPLLIYNPVRCLSDTKTVAAGTVLEKKIDASLSSGLVDISNAQEGMPCEEVKTVIETIVPNLSDTAVTQLGLASNWTPVGWCLHFLELLHSAFPWWASIAMATVVFRIAMFPFIIKSQRSSAKMSEFLPEQAKLKEKMNEARVVGDTVEFSRLSRESQVLFQRHGVNPFTAMLAPLVQAPVFITFFVTLRRMANYPVESLKTGGLWWFSDLSIPDPYVAMPIFCCVTLWITLETSFRSGMNPNQNPWVKYGMRIIPWVTLPFTYNFPTAIMTYWCTNNLLSVTQVVLLRNPRVREFLNIPQIKINPMQLDVNKKSFKTHFKESMDNAKINRVMEERRTLDEMNFRKAGIGPLKKTYKYNPLVEKASKQA